MTSPCHRRERPLATIALLTAFTFGCTTIRAPVATFGGAIPIRDGTAAPQLELWLESADPIKPEEAARVSGKARAALEAALAGRAVGDGRTVLVVRAQGVTRSTSHKNDQVGATVALALTAVVVVVGLVLWLASGGKGSGGGSSAPAARSGGHATHGGARPPPPALALPVAGGARPVPSPSGGGYRAPPAAPRPSPMAVRPPPAAARPPPHRHEGSSTTMTVGLNLDLGEVVQPGPGELVAVSSRDLPESDPAMTVTLAAATDQAPAADGGLAPLEAGLVMLPAFPPLQVAERGFFDGDSLVLELTLVDRATGEPRWTKWVEAPVDPLDAQAVLRVVDRALGAAGGWQPAR